MARHTETVKLFLIGVITAFAALSFVGTTIIRIPIPATGGYFNLGDTFVMIAAILYGPFVGFCVGFIGPALADAIGFPQFILATAVVKGLEGLVVGLVARKSETDAYMRVTFSLLLGTSIIVAGYFIFEASIYPILAVRFPFFGVTDKNAAIAELFPNTLQGVLSSLLAFGIWRVLKGRKNL